MKLRLDRKGLKERVQKECLLCGKKIEVHPYRNKTAKFCSRKCQNIWLSKNRHHTTIQDLKRDLSWASDLAYIIGFVLGDGSIPEYRCKRYRVKFFNTHPKIMTHIEKILEKRGFRTSKELGTDSKAGWIRKIPCYVIRTSSKRFYSLIKNVKVDLNRIPPRFRKDFVRGFFDAEGSYFQSKIRTASFTNSDLRLLNFTRYVLKKLGFSPSRPYSHSTKNCYHFTIHRKGEPEGLIETLEPIKVGDLNQTRS